MFEVLPEPEFSTWFEALAEPLAEEVAGALDLVASAGGVLEPTRLSRALLWFDGMPGTLELAPGSSLLGISRLVLSEAVQAVRDLLAWHQEVVRVLESEAFSRRLLHSSPALAREALVSVEQLKRELHAARMQASIKQSWRSQQARLELSRTKLEKTFGQLLELVGLGAKSVGSADSGLRELTITTTHPELHVLLGLDADKRRLIAILGEALDRSYYGDSVRRAEARWSAYLLREQALHARETPAAPRRA